MLRIEGGRGINDGCSRVIDYLRVSVTDGCNLRCIYCMRPEGVALHDHNDVLSFEEIATVVTAAAELGVRKVWLTGGEPLVRLGLADLVGALARIVGVDDLSLSTNGMPLKPHATERKAAGLKRVSISLDSLQPEMFRRISRCGDLADVLSGIEAVRDAGLVLIKINTVVMRGVNDDEVEDLAGPGTQPPVVYQVHQEDATDGERVGIRFFRRGAEAARQPWPLGSRIKKSTERTRQMLSLQRRRRKHRIHLTDERALLLDLQPTAADGYWHAAALSAVGCWLR